MQRLVQLFYVAIESRTDKQLPTKLKVHVIAGFGQEEGFGITVILRAQTKQNKGGWKT